MTQFLTQLFSKRFYILGETFLFLTALLLNHIQGRKGITNKDSSGYQKKPVDSIFKNYHAYFSLITEVTTCYFIKK